MTTSVTTHDGADRVLEVLVSGNLGVLTPPERLEYYNRVCDSLGLNPMTQPFAFITLNGKLTLYALKGCTDQLRRIHGVSLKVDAQQPSVDMYMVTATAVDGGGRQDSDIGVVSTKGLSGEALANAIMKATTKAKRRVTLSICGLGMLDETEIADIPASAKRAPVVMPQSRIAAPAVNQETGEIIDAEPAALAAPRTEPALAAANSHPPSQQPAMGLGDSEDDAMEPMLASFYQSAAALGFPSQRVKDFKGWATAKGKTQAELNAVLRELAEVRRSETAPTR